MNELLISSPFVAQHGEDRWMHEHWLTLGLPSHGYFVEVGAGDGFLYSNTYWLERAKGWTGMLVEPDPRLAEPIRHNRPGIIIETVAAAESLGTVTLGLMKEPLLTGILRKGIQRVNVPSATLSALLERHHVERVDVVSIDTEGTELEVWAGLDLSRWRPRLAIIEWYTVGLADKKTDIITRLTDDGYRLEATLGGNLVFRDRE